MCRYRKLSSIVKMENYNFEEIKPDDEVGRIIQEEMLSKFCTKYMMVGKDCSVVPSYYIQYAEEIKDFEVYDDDVWVISHPKAGKQKSHNIGVL